MWWYIEYYKKKILFSPGNMYVINMEKVRTFHASRFMQTCDGSYIGLTYHTCMYQGTLAHEYTTYQIHTLDVPDMF